MWPGRFSDAKPLWEQASACPTSVVHARLVGGVFPLIVGTCGYKKRVDPAFLGKYL